MGNRCADVIVIGGGVIGNATAYYLAKKGCSVIVLEKSDHLGNGGSSRNGGGTDVEYCQDGNLRLGKTEEHMKILSGLAENTRSCGLDVRMISGEEVREICPYLSDEVIGASWCPTDGHANPMLTTLAFYKKARELGARFITGEEVTEIRKIRGKARQVITKENVYEGENIILAAGLESREIAGTVGVDIPMQPALLECLVTEAEPEMFGQMLGTAEADFYGHPASAGAS